MTVMNVEKKPFS